MNQYTKQVLNKHGNWELTKTGRTKYFKNGRANLHVEIRYNIERVYTLEERIEIEENRAVETGYFWIPTKKEALQVWRELTKKGTLRGTPVKA